MTTDNKQWWAIRILAALMVAGIAAVIFLLPAPVVVQPEIRAIGE